MSTTTAPVPICLDDIMPVMVADVPISYPDGTPTGWHVTVAGPCHPATVAADADTSLNELDRLALRILGWPAVDMDGVPFPFTPEAVAELLTAERLEPAFRQILEYLDSPDAFAPSPTKAAT
ncbi:hypothetical protein [Niveispirillum sp. KHB5.9]|uniref:hypothetical protein n=1 Tax=Niveispirillum sp. KHB5.9 TaxID=3400269 RepID=UPI003A87F468